ncbi:MAG TPA: PqqD family protein [Acidobacteriaceae bacterium]|nr:PqqD family protein [Acidobacteriaceae bacterium]
MGSPDAERPLRLQSDKVIVEELPHELMIYDSARRKAFCLNQTAAFVWRLSDGTRTIAEIAALMGGDLGKPVDEHVVLFTLDALSQDGLLSASTVLPPLPSGVTRRSLLRRFGIGAVTVPVVTALLISPAKAHASSFETAFARYPGRDTREFVSNRP